MYKRVIDLEQIDSKMSNIIDNYYDMSEEELIKKIKYVSDIKACEIFSSIKNKTQKICIEALSKNVFFDILRAMHIASTS